jgi:hypothetical protein
MLLMLTIAKLQILITYHWHPAVFTQQASTAEKALLTDINWHDLAEMLQDLKLYHQQLLSQEYAHRLYGRLLAACADEATAQTFIGYASTL